MSYMTQTKITWEIPIKTVSEANVHEHWTESSKRHREQQFFVRAAFAKEGREIPVPCKITLTRLNSRALDDGDNLPMAFKWIRDEISEQILCDKKHEYLNFRGCLKHQKGRWDDSPLLQWEYAQEKSKTQGIRVEIEPAQ
jgi:hypothetical protein